MEDESDDASHGMHVSDEENSDPDVLSTSLAAQSSRRCRTTLTRVRNNYMWGPATRRPQLDNFSGNPGPTVLANVTDIGNCLEYFQLIISDDILDIVIDETNRYADQFFTLKAGTLPKHSRANNWKPLTLQS